MEIAGIKVKIQADSRDLEKGYDKAESRTKDLEGAFGSLEKRTSRASGAMSGLAKTMMIGVGGAAGIAVIGALKGMIDKYGGLANTISVLAGDMSEMDIVMNRLTKAMNANVGAAQAEIARLKALLKISNDVSASINARQQAIDRLNNDYKGRIKISSIEAAATKEVADQVDRLTASIIRQAKVKGLESAIAKEFQKLTDLNTSEGMVESLDWWDKLKVVASGSVGGVAGAVTKAAKIIGGNISSTEKRVEKFNEVLERLLGEDAAEGTLFVPKPPKERKVKEVVDKYANILNKHAKKLELGGWLRYDTNIFNLPSVVKFEKDVTTLTQKLEAALKPKGRSGLDTLLSSTGSAIIDSKVMENANKLIAIQNSIQERNESIAMFLTQSLQPAFTNVFESIIDGGKLSADSLAQSIGSMIKRLIAATAAAAALSAILSGLKLGFGGAKGFSGIFNKLTGFGGASGIQSTGGDLPMLAKGGIISGPTLAMVGEYPGASGNPEVIAPLDKLERIMGGGSGGNLTARVSGSDLLFILNRAGRSQGRQG